MYYDTHINGGEYSSLILGNVNLLVKIVPFGEIFIGYPRD